MELGLYINIFFFRNIRNAINNNNNWEPIYEGLVAKQGFFVFPTWKFENKKNKKNKKK